MTETLKVGPVPEQLRVTPMRDPMVDLEGGGLAAAGTHRIVAQDVEPERAPADRAVPLAHGHIRTLAFPCSCVRATAATRHDRRTPRL